MSVNTIEKLFVEELKDLYSAENQITKALPKLAEAASSKELQNALEHHLKETAGHVRRLEQVFEILGASPKGRHAMG
jgi:ferritin-like metal-binding protein YciE